MDDWSVVYKSNRNPMWDSRESTMADSGVSNQCKDDVMQSTIINYGLSHCGVPDQRTTDVAQSIINKTVVYKSNNLPMWDNE